MRVKSIVTVGFLSMVVATGVASASEDVASEAHRVNVIERIGAGGSAYFSNQPDNAGMCPVTGIKCHRTDWTWRIDLFFQPVKVCPGGRLSYDGRSGEKGTCRGAHRGRRIDLFLQPNDE